MTIFIVWALSHGPATTLEAVGAVVGTGILAFLSVLARVLTPPAASVAAGFGIIIVLLGGVPYLALLVLFVVGSSLATRFRFQEKKARKVSEGSTGERGVSNVLAHIIIPLAIVAGASQAGPSLAPLAPFVYTSALACGAADTFASEFGVLSGSAVSILNGAPVPPGTNGGVSLYGEWWALVGSGSTAILAWGLFQFSFQPFPTDPVLWLLGGTALGWAGCQVDSLLGATLENRGYIGKGATNFLAMLVASLLAVGLFLR